MTEENSTRSKLCCFFPMQRKIIKPYKSKTLLDENNSAEIGGRRKSKNFAIFNAIMNKQKKSQTNEKQKGKTALLLEEKQPEHPKILDSMNNNETEALINTFNSKLSKLQMCEAKLSEIFGKQISQTTKKNILNDKKITSQDLSNILESIDCRLDSCRWRAESANYLLWLGVVDASNQRQAAIPGITASPPNPHLEAIRLTDSEIRITLAEHQKLCTETDMPEDIRQSLTSNEFNNWPHSDAMLMRLIRQMYTDLGLTKPHLPIDIKDLDAWIQIVYKRYNQVPFHNFKHAFMVTQMSYVLLTGGKLKNTLDKFHQCVLITAAICHDLDHPGFNNSYQINAQTQLALRYNDRSPLENHHASTAFDILYLSGPNPFKFDRENSKLFREGIIKCILATDMSSHNDILSTFTQKVLDNRSEMVKINPETGKPKWVDDKQTLYLVLSILIKVSDISNESRPINVAGEWIDRLLEEFFMQSDYEKVADLPYASFMDRDKVSKPASQCSFIQFVILPLFKSLCELIPELEPIVIQPALKQLEYYSNLLPSSDSPERG